MLRLSILIALATVAATFADSPTTQPAAPKPPPQLAYEQFTKLEGKWVGKSTKGWEEKSTYATIAAGSAVMHTSFEAHPGQQMLTVFHMDGADLMLTHYCVAKNQPRMRATKISADGREITFEFIDGTNMASRDKGHMDKAVYRFGEDGTFTTQWTWYQNGQERWMEEIHCQRSQ